MSEDHIRRDDAATEANTELTGPVDPHAKVLHGLPRMRAIEIEGSKEFVPPPPMVSRISGLTQGCGGMLLIIMGALLSFVAFQFGYYLWGPGLLLVGGILLIWGTKGVWQGHRTPVVVSIITLVILAGIGYLWSSFIPVGSAIFQQNFMGLFLGIAPFIILMALFVAFISHVVSLFYWKKLKQTHRRGIKLWAAAAVILVVFILGAHFLQQWQRKDWLQNQFDTWSAEANTDTLLMGSNTNITLGYSFVTLKEDGDTRFEIMVAELEASIEARAAVLRLMASGDMLFEEEIPRLFPLDEEEDQVEEQQKVDDRLARQHAAEADFMAHVLESGADLLLADNPVSYYLLVWNSDEDDTLTWADFTSIQERRIRHYARLYQPAYYEIVNSPGTYGQYSEIAFPDDADPLELWVAQTERLIDVVHEESPETVIGVTLAQVGFDLEFYDRVLQLEGIDFFGFRLFKPGDFKAIEQILEEHGHPADYDKQLWIIETWYGYCLAPQRSMELDAIWLEAVAAFAAKETISAVLVNDYGCFLNAGGTFAQPDMNLDERTDVWNRWQQLISHWQPS